MAAGNMQPMPILFCDLDDTIVDRAETLRRWACAFAEHYGLGDDAVDVLVAEDGGGTRERDEFAAAICQRFSLGDVLNGQSFMAAFIEMFRCDETTVSALRRARSAGWKIAVITNGGGPAQTGKIRAAALDGLVDAVCISSLEGCAKPDPKLFAIAARRLSLTLDGSWMIGDNAENDIGGVVASGISSVWLCHGRTWQRPDFRPTAEADSFADAVDIVLSGAGLS